MTTIYVGKIYHRYKKDSKLDFGLYKGKELGIVYAFDPGYIDWCINNIHQFYIEDIDDLISYGVINQDMNWQYRAVGEQSFIPNIDAFDTFEELLEIIALSERKSFFSSETVKKNKNRGC